VKFDQILYFIFMYVIGLGTHLFVNRPNVIFFNVLYFHSICLLYWHFFSEME